MSKGPFAIAAHGGAGTLRRERMTAELERAYQADLQTALATGHAILTQCGSSLDAVVSVVTWLEDAPRFNAGKGSVLTERGEVQMEASIMCGRTLRAGAATGLRQIKNPVRLARAILEHSPHVMLGGAGAEAFARAHGVAFEAPAYFVTEQRQKQLARVRAKNPAGSELSEGEESESLGTVGAVALDAHGHIASATSTGGTTHKASGRIGDSPIIGAGNYADDRTAAVSTTGHGEMFLRVCAAHDVCARIRHGATLDEAAHAVIHGEVAGLGGTGGLIAIDARGQIVLCLNSEAMYRGSIDTAGNLSTAIFSK